MDFASESSIHNSFTFCFPTCSWWEYG